MAQARIRALVSSEELLTELSRTHQTTELPSEDPDTAIIAVETAAGDYVVRVSTHPGASSYMPEIGRQGERGFRPASRFDASRGTVVELANEIRDRAAALEQWAARRDERIVEVARVASDLGLQLRDGDPIRCHEGPNRNVTVLCRETWLVTFDGLTEAQARALLELHARLRG